MELGKEWCDKKKNVLICVEAWVEECMWRMLWREDKEREREKERKKKNEENVQ